jgi:hypothetical protein
VVLVLVLVLLVAGAAVVLDGLRVADAVGVTPSHTPKVGWQPPAQYSLLLPQ